MSIAVAVQKDGVIALATDSVTTFGEHQESTDNLDTNKIRNIGEVYLASAGWSVYDNIIDDFLAKQEQVPQLADKVSIYNFFLSLWKALHNDYSFVKDQGSDEKSPFGDLDASFIVVNTKGIFHVSSDMAVTKFEKYTTIGSGVDYALGAINACYADKSVEEIARIAVETTSKFNIYCGGDTKIVTLQSA